MNICKNCNAQMDDSDQICRFCGTPVGSDGPVAEPASPDAAPGSGSAGYSRLVDSDEVRSALKKNARISNLVLIVFVFLPFLGFLIYGAVSDKMDFGKAAVYGLIVSAIFAVISLFVALKRKLTKPFEGTVVDKKKSFRMARNNGAAPRTKYTVRIDCEDGKRRKKEVSIPVYEYLEVGDRVRYLPRFPQSFEKYDKRADGEVLCMFCSRRNPLSETTCSFCHKPLIK